MGSNLCILNFNEEVLDWLHRKKNIIEGMGQTKYLMVIIKLVK